MPLHDWARVDAGIFHAFHVAWLPELQKALNSGLLPEGYYALAEQHAGRAIADVLTLHASPAPQQAVPVRLPLTPLTGGVALADAPPGPGGGIQSSRRPWRAAAHDSRRRIGPAAGRP